MIKDQRRVKQRIKMHIYLQGYVYDLSKLRWSKKSINMLEEFSKTQDDQYVLNCIYQLQKLKELELSVTRNIRDLSKTERFRMISSLLQSIPGISVLNSMILLTEIVDIKRFRNLDHLCSYVGLVPDTRNSGEVQRVGGLTYRSNKRLRTLLVEASWVAIRHDLSLIHI